MQPLIRPTGLRRAESSGADRRATWLELFFDLAFAAAIADAGSALSADYTPEGLLRFGVLFFMIWWAWVGHTFFSTWFDNDDLVHRLLTLGQVFLVMVMSINTETDMASREAAGFAAAYAGLRLLLAVQFGRVRSVPETRPFVRVQLIGTIAASLLWLGVGTAPSWLRLWLLAAALAVEVATPLVARRAGGVVPADPAHLPERFGLFTLILVGESVLAIAAGMRHQEHWTAGAATSALLGMALAFAVWWAYFDTFGVASPETPDATGQPERLRGWTGTHLPLTFGIAVAAIGIEHTIRLDGVTPLGESAALLALGVGMVVGALGLLAAARPRRLPGGRQLAIRSTILASLAIPVALAGGSVAPVWLLAWCVGLMIAAIALAHRARGTEPARIPA
ncbi:MAG: low temperature requirement protein A [Gemmatimonadetes bacterium]|nr:low temperature requirement protein A [Gemmatimonadota bacterium]